MQKTYTITYYGLLGESKTKIKAINKTIARKIFKGEMNPSCKIIKIEEEK